MSDRISAEDFAYEMGRRQGYAEARDAKMIDNEEFKLACEQIDKLEAQLEAAQEALFQVCVECGEDMDGAQSLSDLGKIAPGIEVWAVRAAKQLRADYDEFLTIPMRLDGGK